MSFLFPNYSRANIEFVDGANQTLIDDQGKEYLDFTSGIGVANLGYYHPVLTKVLHEQVDKLWHIPNLYESKLQEQVAEKLANGKDYVGFFCNSGAEANEAAIKLARKATGRTEIISFHQSFHGRTYGAMSATGQESIHEGFDPLVPDFKYIPFNEWDIFPEAITETTACVMVEMIQGEGGVLPANKKWLKYLAEHTQKVGALLVVDEVQTGIGRTGSLFAFEQYDIEPDVYTVAKGLGNGVPVGAMLAKGEYAPVFSPGSHGTTFGGNRLALSVADKVLDIINQKAFLEDVKKKEYYLFNLLYKGLRNSQLVQEVRGMGLMVGIVLADETLLGKAISDLQEKGLLTLKAGKNVLRLLPPLTITKQEIEQAVSLIIEELTILEETAWEK
ncbi:MAG: acetylornithine transaminase [Lactobacillales bacterium]|jgi:acetylornithine aminotransferase|nr:acetylornithine transaminase [Lactobacillales bacterium]